MRIKDSGKKKLKNFGTGEVGQGVSVKSVLKKKTFH